MTGKPAPGLFITGTSTGVGKTVVASAIARAMRRQGLRVGVYKPVLSGYATDLSACSPAELLTSRDDDVALWNAAGRPGELDRVCPQRFRSPLAPPLAARAEGREVDARLLRSGIDYWRELSDVVLVEGAGGLMSPLTTDQYVADLAYDLAYPLVVVAANELGVINQTLQTLITAAHFRGGLPVAGVVLNHPHAAHAATDPSTVSNRRELERLCPVPVLAELGWGADEFDQLVDWIESGGH